MAFDVWIYQIFVGINEIRIELLKCFNSITCHPYFHVSSL